MLKFSQNSIIFPADMSRCTCNFWSKYQYIPLNVFKTLIRQDLWNCVSRDSYVT